MRARHRTSLAGVLIFLCCALSACTVQFVSLYDEQTEQQITALQRKTETLIEDLARHAGKPEGAHEHFTERYADIKVDAAVLHTRAQALPLNENTSQQAGELVGWLENLEALHKQGISHPSVLIPVRSQAQSIYVGMLKSEIAKKREVRQVNTQED